MKFREISCDGVDSVQLTQCSQMMTFSEKGSETFFSTKGRFYLNPLNTELYPICQ